MHAGLSICLSHKYQDLFADHLLFYLFQERVGLIDKQYTADKEKLHKIRLLLVRNHQREHSGSVVECLTRN